MERPYQEGDTVLIPDIIADVEFFSTEKGGRQLATPEGFFGCPIVFGSRAFDCRMLLDRHGPIYPGTSAVMPIKLLNPEFALRFISAGSEFKIRDLGTIGRGVVLEVLRQKGGAD